MENKDEKRINTPAEIISVQLENAKKKVSWSFGKLVLLGILAGAFIALGAASSATATFGIENPGLAKFISGCIFPVGLMMIVICGGELFTGNCLIGMAALDKKITWGRLIRNLIIVWFSNFIGAAAVALIVYLSGNLDLGGGALAAYAIKVAVGKVSLDFVPAFFSGILCNMLVCLAVLMSTAAKDAAGKILGIFFPICAFVTAGYEHCVANMYYIPVALFALTNPEYAQMAQDLYGYTEGDLAALNFGSMFSNIIPVTIGNIIGGGIFVGIVYYVIYVRNKKK